VLKKTIEIAVSHQDAAVSDKEFWASQTREARLQHALELRRINYGTDRVSGRLKRVLEITQRPAR
jgi:hypothetical protein